MARFEFPTKGPFEAYETGSDNPESITGYPRKWRIRTAWPNRTALQQILIAEVLENEEGPSRTRANARFLAQSGEILDLCNLIQYFWMSDPEAFGDEASVTSLAGRFAPIADKAREILDVIYRATEEDV